ncbi:MAG: cupredoxin domain-containing protein [Coriobacteriia bacterium]
MLRTVRLILPMLVVASLLIGASPALGGEVGWQSVDVILHADEQQPMLLVSGELPAATPLPFEAELAVPTGAQVQWIGEILGGPVSEDPQVQYTKTTEGSMDVYRFTLTKSRIAQAEVTVPGITGFNGTNYTSALAWTAWRDLPEVRIAQRLPQGSQIVQPLEGASLEPGAPGYTYYAKTVKSPRAGDVLNLAFAYSPAVVPAAGAGAAGSAGSSTLVWVFGLAAALILGALVFVAWRTVAVPAVAEEVPVSEKKESPVHATAAVTASGADGSRGAAPAAQPLPVRRIKPTVVILGVVVVLMFGTVIAISGGTSPKVTGTVITKSFGAVNPCDATSIPVMANQGVDLADQGEALVDSFAGQEGIGDVKLDVARGVIDVSFCESSQSEQTVRQTLEGSGLVSLGAAPVASAPSTATVDASGTLQTATVETASGAFDPGTVVLKAGVPAQISFGQAAGCLTEVVVADLGLTQDLTAGAATLKLPALEPGTYQFACAMGHQTGQFVVE